MSLKRVGILLGKELWQGPKNFLFVWVIVMPIIISLVVSLIFGTLFTEKPELGVVDEGSSQLVTMAEQLTSVVTEEYDNVSEIKQAVESGAVDIGMVIPADFDSSVIQGKKTELTTYIWGESLAKNRTILGITIANLIRELAGQEVPVEIEAITLGDEVSIPWNDRLLPLVVLMAVFLGGLFLPAASVIDEKEKKTLEALVVTPASVGDIFIAKGLMGVILSLFMGVVILVLNQAFGTGGILLFGPAIIYMFPQIPQWIGKLFPTYYFLQPIIAISQGGSGWSDIATNVFILIALDLILVAVVVFAVRRTKQFAV
ncbi:hypothetical protein ES703_51323 [subsurface metagenome]